MHRVAAHRASRQIDKNSAPERVDAVIEDERRDFIRF
jgi:hypothetical protein